MKRTLLVMGLCGTLVAASAWASSADRRVAAADQQGKDADNTGRNVRDRNDGHLTPMDQGSSEGDRTITREIRRHVTDRDELSTNAKNIKIITVDGVVTLRGPVKTEQEKTTIAGIARQQAGVKRVDDQIEVERNP